jgi:diphosphomevalonate decarboxylase
MLDYTNPKLVVGQPDLLSGRSAWRSPSNIAIVKYWGKHGKQLPRNASISFTLSAAYTETEVLFQPRAATADIRTLAIDFLFDGQPQPAFATKIAAFLESLRPIFPFLSQFHWSIRSHNSFPHSAGIASSASAMSALALCLVDIEHQLFGTPSTTQQHLTKASYIARLGSGSACRSLFPVLSVWGQTGLVPQATDEYGIGVSAYHPVFAGYRDAILIVSAEEKSVSSRAGHALMENNPFAPARYDQAKRHLHQVLEAMTQGDIHTFGRIAEDEALSLHALMMCSQPSYLLMRPGTLAVIERVRQWRHDTGHALYFTLDAGPNVHLLYPESDAKAIEAFIASDLVPFCAHGQVIYDRVGQGPEAF